MKISVTITRKIYHVTFPDGIDYKKLAAKAGVSNQVAYHWLETGSVHELYIAILKKIPYAEVKGCNGSAK